MKNTVNRILFMLMLISILSLGYTIFYDTRVVKTGVVAAKSVVMEHQGRHTFIGAPKVGMRFDDGSEEDIEVTLATYEKLNVGDKTSFLVYQIPRWYIWTVILSMVSIVVSCTFLLIRLFDGDIHSDWPGP